MSKSKPIDLEHIKKIDERIAKEYPNKKKVALGKILATISKVKKKGAIVVYFIVGILDTF